MHLEQFFEWATKSFELLGVLSMVVGFVYAFALAAVTWKRTADGRRAFKTLRESLEFRSLISVARVNCGAFVT